MNDWEHTRPYERQRGCLQGHKETEIVTHKANITAKSQVKPGRTPTSVFNI